MYRADWVAWAFAPSLGTPLGESILVKKHCFIPKSSLELGRLDKGVQGGANDGSGPHRKPNQFHEFEVF